MKKMRENMKKILVIFLLITSFLFGKKIHLNKIKLPKNFKIEVFAKNVYKARAISLSPKGLVFVGSKSGHVYVLTDKNKDGKIEKKYIIARNLDLPVGVAYHKGNLYVSEVNRVLVYRNIDQNYYKKPKPKILYSKFPKDRHHGWKFIAVGPDNYLYVPIGAPCNVCYKKDVRYSTITRLKLDGTGFEVYAYGIRNTVGFDWHPITKKLWFTDNGRDYMGDNLPPDELNNAINKGMHFGFPFIHGNKIKDPYYYKRKGKKNTYTKPIQELGPHVAALGMRFYTGKMFPEKYKNQIFIAEHGSWNRSKPIGYRVTLVTLKKNQPKYQVFAFGWLQGSVPWGRPVDVQVYYDGSLLVSDDFAGVVYRIYYDRN